MTANFIRNCVSTVTILFISMTMFAQAPFTGSSQFRKFSIGINGGLFRPSLIIGGNNDFTKPLYTFGYGANVKYQITHYFALQADIVRGTIKGDNSKNYPTVPSRSATDRRNSSFKTDMNYAASISGVITFGNVNWLNIKNWVVPYISAGGGITHYKPTYIKTGTTTEVAFNNGKIVKEFFVPVGIGLKFSLTDQLNLDLGYRAHFVDTDNFDGTPDGVYGVAHKDKFSHGFLGIEFAFGKKPKKQLMFDNPAAFMNESLQSQIHDIQSKVDTLKTAMKDSDSDRIAHQFNKAPNTPASSPANIQGVSIDTDGDGVPDKDDKCPNIKGTRENEGCPFPPIGGADMVAISPDSVTYAIYFAYDQSDLVGYDFAVLNRIMQILQADKALTVHISGFADTLGSRAKNMQVSAERAKVALQYFLSYNISGSRITTSYYGSGKPLDNIRQWRNRRAEITIIKH